MLDILVWVGSKKTFFWKNVFYWYLRKIYFCSFICQLQVKNLIEKRPKVNAELWTEVRLLRGHWGWTRLEPQDPCQHLRKNWEGKPFDEIFFFKNLDFVLDVSLVIWIFRLFNKTPLSQCALVIFTTYFKLRINFLK